MNKLINLQSGALLMSKMVDSRSCKLLLDVASLCPTDLHIAANKSKNNGRCLNVLGSIWPLILSLALPWSILVSFDKQMCRIAKGPLFSFGHDVAYAMTYDT